MSIRVTCEVQHDAGGSGPRPAPYVRECEGEDPTEPWLACVREAYALHEIQPLWIEAGTYPVPDGLPWSARGIEPKDAPYESEVWYSVEAWRQRRSGSRYQVLAETMDAGFSVTWTLEII